MDPGIIIEILVSFSNNLSSSFALASLSFIKVIIIFNHLSPLIGGRAIFSDLELISQLRIFFFSDGEPSLWSFRMDKVQDLFRLLGITWLICLNTKSKVFVTILKQCFNSCTLLTTLSKKTPIKLSIYKSISRFLLVGIENNNFGASANRTKGWSKIC